MPRRLSMTALLTWITCWYLDMTQSGRSKVGGKEDARPMRVCSLDAPVFCLSFFRAFFSDATAADVERVSSMYRVSSCECECVLMRCLLGSPVSYRIVYVK